MAVTGVVRSEDGYEAYSDGRVRVYRKRARNLGWIDLLSENRVEMPHGGGHFNAVLTEEVVVAARELYAVGWTYRCILDKFDNKGSISTLMEAVLGRTWKHLSAPIPPSRGSTRRPLSSCPCPAHRKET